MPYDNIKELPKYVKKYSPKVQRMFMHVFNTTYNKVLKETKDKQQAEKRAFKSANAVVKTNIEKFGASRYTENTVVEFLIDRWLNNI